MCFACSRRSSSCASFRRLRPGCRTTLWGRFAKGPADAALLAAEARLALGKERRNAFAEIFRVETSVAFVKFRFAQRARIGQAANEFLVPARGERRAFCD